MGNITKPTINFKTYTKRLWTVARFIAKELPLSFNTIWKINKVIDEAYDYVIEGTAIDHEWLINNRELLESHTLEDMRYNGFIPILDISPGLTFEFDAETENFNYKIVVKGLRDRQAPTNIMGILAYKGLVIGAHGEVVPLLDSKL